MLSHSMDMAGAATNCEQPVHTTSRHYFFITGRTSVDLVSRVLAPFVKYGFSPYRIHVSSENGGGEETNIELRVAGLSTDKPELLAAACRRIVGVQTVLTISE